MTERQAEFVPTRPFSNGTSRDMWMAGSVVEGLSLSIIWYKYIAFER